MFPEAAVGRPGLYLVSQPVRYSCLTDCTLLVGTAVQQMIASCGDCFEKDKETKGRKLTPTTVLVVARFGKWHSWAAGDHSHWLCPAPQGQSEYRGTRNSCW